MDNQKGGQANTPPSWNAWGQMAAKNASNNATQNVDNAKAAELSSMQKQQQTATELARKRVLEAYKHSPQDYKAPTQSSPAPQANADDWRRYQQADDLQEIDRSDPVLSAFLRAFGVFGHGFMPFLTRPAASAAFSSGASAQVAGCGF